MSVIAVLPGDGVGPDVTNAAFTVLDKAADKYGLSVERRDYTFGGAAIDAVGHPLPDDTRAGCLAADAVFLGAVGGPKWDAAARAGGPRPEAGLLALREALGVYANLRPIRIHDGLEGTSPLRAEIARGVDILIVRELTGGLYFGKREEGTTRATDECAYTAEEVARVAHKAFAAARGRGKRVTSVDKANVLATSRLWRHVVETVAADYPDVALDHMLVDAMAMKLVSQPASYDVLLTENLFGDILSDEASVIAGSIGLAPSASLGDGARGLYEPIHGSAPDIAGKDIANPAGAILSAALLLRHSLNAPEAASAIDDAVSAAIAAGERTGDLGGTLGTQAFAAAVAARL